MGILNVTPDSFSDGGRHATLQAAIRHAHRMIDEGADLIDIGGESTRPGAPMVSLEEEMQRVLPVVEALRDVGLPLSIDTYKPGLMQAALDAGADMINDIRAFTVAGALEVVAERDCGVCPMHMQGEPSSMQSAPQYADVVAEVRAFLARRLAALEAAGVQRERIVLDPGFGFGKSRAHNYALLRDLPELRVGGLPLLAGLSRKSMLELGKVGRPASERVAASIAALVCAIERGASIVRVHDVAASAEAIAVWREMREAGSGGDEAGQPLA